MHVIARALLFVIFVQISEAQNVCTSQPIAAVSKKEFSSEQFDQLGKVPAFVKWDAAPGASYYYLTVSQFADFQKGRVFKTKKNQMPLMVYPNTKYYWKVEAFDSHEARLPFESLKANQLITKYTGTGDFLSQRETYKSSRAPAQTKTENSSTACSSYQQNNEDQKRRISSVPPQSMIVNVYDHYPQWLENYKFWMTTEAGLLKLTQSHTVLSSVDASGTMLPSVGLNFQTRQYWNFLSTQFYFQQIVGKFKINNTNFTLIDSDFQWVRYGGLINLHVLKTQMFGKPLQMTPYLGYEKQKTPYFTQLSPTTVVVRDIELSNLIAGLRFDLKKSNAWSYYLNTSYSQALNGNSDTLNSTDIQSGSLIEAQLGTLFHSSKTGFFAGGSLKLAQRSIEENVITSNSLSSVGDRKSNYSALEFLAGLTF